MEDEYGDHVDQDTEPKWGVPKGAAVDVIDIDDIFNLFFDDALIDVIVYNTNLHINGDIAPVTANEIKAYLGLLVYTATLNKSQHKIDELFSNYNNGHDIFCNTLSKRRFTFLLDSVKFDDAQTETERSSTDVLAPLRYLMDNILTKCLDYFEPGENLTIDDQFLPYLEDDSELKLSQNPKRGIKILSMIDSTSLYCVNMEVCIENHSLDSQALDLADEEAIMRLVSPIADSNRNITLNSRCMSIQVGDKLLSQNLTVIGALKKNDLKELPISCTSRSENGCNFDFTESSTLMTFAPRNSEPMILLSTIHSHRQSAEEDINVDLKSRMLDLYSQTIGAVDSYERLCSRYCIGIGQQKWELVVFFQVLNMCTINSNIIFNHNNNIQMERKMFLEELARFLVEPFQKEKQSEFYNDRNYEIGSSDEIMYSDGESKKRRCQRRTRKRKLY